MAVDFRVVKQGSHERAPEKLADRAWVPPCLGSIRLRDEEAAQRRLKRLETHLVHQEGHWIESNRSLLTTYASHAPEALLCWPLKSQMAPSSNRRLAKYPTTPNTQTLAPGIAPIHPFPDLA